MLGVRSVLILEIRIVLSELSDDSESDEDEDEEVELDGNDTVLRLLSSESKDDCSYPERSKLDKISSLGILTGIDSAACFSAYSLAACFFNADFSAS